MELNVFFNFCLFKPKKSLNFALVKNKNMISYNKYTNSRDYTWYDSSNVIHSECIDTNDTAKSLKIVFKGGRTYLYRNVDVNDYVLFKTAQSTGEGFNKHIKKYKSVRLPDIDITTLNEKQREFQEETKIVEEAITNLAYKLEINKETQEFRLSLNDKVIYEGVENQVSIIRLLKSMCINYSFDELTEPIIISNDFSDATNS